MTRVSVFDKKTIVISRNFSRKLHQVEDHKCRLPFNLVETIECSFLYQGRFNDNVNARPNLFLSRLSLSSPLSLSLSFFVKPGTKYKLDFRYRAELLFYVRRLPAVNPCRLSIRLPLRYLNSSSILIFIRTAINFYGRPFTF